MTPSEIVGEIYRERTMLSTITELLQQQAVAKAEAEFHYNTLRGQAIKKYRGAGYGVNLCDSLAHGDEEVARAKQELSQIESMYFTTRSRLENVRADLSTLKTLLSVETEVLKEG